jgi:hypothetical protein
MKTGVNVHYCAALRNALQTTCRKFSFFVVNSAQDGLTGMRSNSTLHRK